MTDHELIDLLLKEKIITPEMVEKVKEETKRTGLPLARALKKLEIVSDKELLRIQANAMGIPYIDLTDYIIDTSLLPLIPEAVAKRFKAVPLFKIGNSLTVGMVDPKDIIAVDHIRKASQMEMVESVLVSEKGIQIVLDSCYTSKGEDFADILKSINKDKIKEAGLAAAAEEAPIIKLVNLMVMRAVKDKASDIHIEPDEKDLRIRCRVDGLLREMAVLPKNIQNAVISRIKILSEIDIAESRKPQDGRIRIKIENKDLDIRVSTFPMVHGENVVMRLLDKTSVLLGLKEIGLTNEGLEIFTKLIHRPNGIILVTGPTGSGKTTTLYTALTAVSSMEKNIVTIEDPVEYELPLIRQTQVNPKAGISFANGLRSILRQDPDIIMVGEIRDKETADMAVQAALTGHLVFSTLHTNDAPSTLTRLIDMGVEPFLVSSSVIGIIAQRLVRVICTKCKVSYTPRPEELSDLGLSEGTQLFRGQGCDKCHKTGFLGRTSIFEILLLNAEVKKMIEKKCSADEIKQKALELGMKTLMSDGLLKARQGITTPEEVLRVTEMEGDGSNLSI